MSSFTNALILKKYQKQEWEVIQDFTYEVGSLGSGEKITVPSGFVTDLASTPRCIWSIFPTDANYSQAAVLHDWLCFKKGNVERHYDNKEASKIFLEAMEVLKVNKASRLMMYYAVLFFGPKF
jgi:hypothetical protein